MKHRDVPPGQEDPPINPFPGGEIWKERRVTVHVPIDLPEAYEQEIQQALQEADEGDFATEEEMQALEKKWSLQPGPSPEDASQSPDGNCQMRIFRRQAPGDDKNREKSPMSRHRQRQAVLKILFEEADVKHMDFLGAAEVIVRLDERGISDSSQADWLMTPNTRLGGETPLRCLEEGRLNEVLLATDSATDT